MKFQRHQRFWLKILACIVFALVLRYINASAQNSQTHWGSVLDISGDWHVSGNLSRRISKGDALPQGGSIWPSRGQDPKNTFIILVPLSGTVTYFYHCDQPGVCDRVIPLPRLGNEQMSLPAMVWTSIKLLASSIWYKPSRAARDQGINVRGEELKDSVVRIKERRVNLNEAFEKVKPGTYKLRFQLVALDKQPTIRSGHFDILFSWEVNKSYPIAVPGLKPGLYRAELLEFTNENPLGTDAWILVTNPGTYEKARASFEEAKRLTQQWGNDTTPDAVRLFLRSYLHYLSLE